MIYLGTYLGTNAVYTTLVQTFSNVGVTHVPFCGDFLANFWEYQGNFNAKSRWSVTTPTECTHLHNKSCLPRFSSLCLFSTSICSSVAASCLLISTRFDNDTIRVWDCHWKQASLRILPKLEETADVVRHKTATYYADCNTPNNRSHLQNCTGMYDIVHYAGAIPRCTKEQ